MLHFQIMYLKGFEDGCQIVIRRQSNCKMAPPISILWVLSLISLWAKIVSFCSVAMKQFNLTPPISLKAASSSSPRYIDPEKILMKPTQSSEPSGPDYTLLYPYIPEATRVKSILES